MATLETLSPGYDFHGLVSQWERRARLQQIITWLPRVLAVALAVGLVLAVVSRVRPLLDNAQLLIVIGALLVVSVIGLAAGVMLWRREPLQSARRFDREFGLQQRVSTALELIEGKIRSDKSLTAHQLQDAYQHASRVRVAEVLPFSAQRRDWMVVAGLAALLALLLVVVPPASAADITAAEQQVAIEEAAEDIKDIMEDVAV